MLIFLGEMIEFKVLRNKISKISVTHSEIVQAEKSVCVYIEIKAL